MEPIIKELLTKHQTRLEQAIRQAMAHGHSFFCYSQPLIKEEEGCYKMSYHFKSFKSQSALNQFIDSQKTYYYVLTLPNKGVVE